MKKVLRSDLILYYSPLFPAKFAPFPKEPIYLGVGGNVGNVERRLKKLALMLRHNPRLRLIATAPLLKNPPFGYLSQPHFFNTVFVIKTSLGPRLLLKRLLAIERRFKRRRTIKNGPRTLDLDILFYGRRRLNSDDLQIPHPHWHERESVIIPLQLLGEG